MRDILLGLIFCLQLAVAFAAEGLLLYGFTIGLLYVLENSEMWMLFITVPVIMSVGVCAQIALIEAIDFFFEF